MGPAGHFSMKSWETPQSVLTTRTLGTLKDTFFTDVSPSLSRESNNKFNHLSPKGRGCKSLQMSTFTILTQCYSQKASTMKCLTKKSHNLISHSNLLCICNNLHATWNTVNTALTKNVRPGTPNLLPLSCAPNIHLKVDCNILFSQRAPPPLPPNLSTHRH